MSKVVTEIKHAHEQIFILHMQILTATRMICPHAQIQQSRVVQADANEKQKQIMAPVSIELSSKRTKQPPHA